MTDYIAKSELTIKFSQILTKSDLKSNLLEEFSIYCEDIPF